MFGCLDTERGTFVYANAGHPAGYVMNAFGEVKAHLSSTSLPLAISSDAKFTLGEPVQLSPGDLVFMLTDGILEARSPDGISFGERRALEAVRSHRQMSAKEIVEGLCRTVGEFSRRQKPEDDITALIVSVQPDR